MAKLRIAVFFGGRSPEHDVSVVTALQVMDALRADRYDIVPVYLSPGGDWFLGEGLRERSFYLPTAEAVRKLSRCHLARGADGTGVLVPERRGFFGGGEIVFDVAIPAFHGAFGEDGCVQGLLEVMEIPYTGMRVLGSAVSMDKAQTKAIVKAHTDVPQLPFLTARKMADGPAQIPDLPEGWAFPLIVKPAHMGSSIGVARVDSREEIEAVLRLIFQYDSKAILEPFIARRREYNISVRRHGAKVLTSAIEMPKSNAELLDFKEKYVSGGGGKKSAPSEGMLSLTRDINPALPPQLEQDLRAWAAAIFTALDGTGAPRLDFILDADSGKTWFNEINPCPGSFAYFLWEASQHRTLFGELLDSLIEEAMEQRRLTDIPADPVPADARLFPRR